MKFPRDSFPHRSPVEWWYFNGNLTDEKGGSYAFMNCLFKTNPKKIGIPFVNKIPAREIYFSHSLLTDIKNKKITAKTHPLSILSKDSLAKKRLFFNYLNPSIDGYVNNEITELGDGEYHIKNEDIDLTLKTKKKPFMHNGNGIFNFKKNKIYYYSFSDMEAKGTIRIGDKTIKVQGIVWMDHEWTGFRGTTNWDWFSIQLTNKTELMIFNYNNGEHVYVGINPKNQKAEFARDLIMLPTNFWKSKSTGANYPTQWKIEVPSKRIVLDIKARSEKQEVVFGSINYWEGPTLVSGKINGKNVKGVGFMELVGRKMSKSNIQIYEQQLKNNASFYIKTAKKDLKHLWKNFRR